MNEVDIKIENRRSDIVIIDKTKKKVKTMDVNIHGEVRVNERKKGKIEKYKMFKSEIAKTWDMKKKTVIPVAVGVLGAVSTGFKKYVVATGVVMKLEHEHKTTLLGTGRILRLVKK